MKYRISTSNERVWYTTQLAKLSFNHSIGRTHSWCFSIFCKNKRKPWMFLKFRPVPCCLTIWGYDFVHARWHQGAKAMSGRGKRVGSGWRWNKPSHLVYMLSYSLYRVGNPYLHDRRANKTRTTRKRLQNHTPRNPFWTHTQKPFWNLKTPRNTTPPQHHHTHNTTRKRPYVSPSTPTRVWRIWRWRR